MTYCADGIKDGVLRIYIKRKMQEDDDDEEKHLIAFQLHNTMLMV